MGPRLVKVETARQMWAACEAELPAGIAVCAAAVADWRPSTSAGAKLKKKDAGLNLALVENPDILAGLSHHAKRPSLVVGFAAETGELIANARAKLAAKGCDWVVANDVSGNVMGGDANCVHLLSANDAEDWPQMSKPEVARRLVDRIAARFGKHAP
jgi:phosphopantothenoylcysteine decarboxylase/phosphopantothenate--cysteine ligase